MSDNFKLRKLAKQAINNNELHLLLTCRNKYAIRAKPDIPTDLSSVINHLYNLCKKDTSTDYRMLFRNAVITLIDSSDAYDIWIAYRICWLQHYRERNFKSPFTLISIDSFIRYKLINAIKANINALKSVTINGISDDNLYDNIVTTETTSYPVYNVFSDTDIYNIIETRKELVTV